MVLQRDTKGGATKTDLDTCWAQGELEHTPRVTDCPFKSSGFESRSACCTCRKSQGGRWKDLPRSVCYPKAGIFVAWSHFIISVRRRTSKKGDTCASQSTLCPHGPFSTALLTVTHLSWRCLCAVAGVNKTTQTNKNQSLPCGREVSWAELWSIRAAVVEILPQKTLQSHREGSGAKLILI